MKDKIKISGAIFDLDGTLLDSMKIWDNLGHDYLVSLGIIPKADLYKKIESMSLLQAAEYFISDYHVALTIPEILAGIDKMLKDFYIFSAPAKSYTKELLQLLKRYGVKMCVATATNKPLAIAALKRNGLLEYFEGVFTCTEVGFGKDSDVIYKKALELLGTGLKETFVFEDALYALQTAKTAGFPVVGVFDEASENQISEIKLHSDIYINSFKEMESYLL